MGRLAERRSAGTQYDFAHELAALRRRAARAHVDVVRRRHPRLLQRVGVDEPGGRPGDGDVRRCRSACTTASRALVAGQRRQRRTTSPSRLGRTLPQHVYRPLRQSRRDADRDHDAATAATSAPRARSSIASRPRSRGSTSAGPTAIATTRSTAATIMKDLIVHVADDRPRSARTRCSCRPATTIPRTRASATRSSTCCTATASSRATSSRCRRSSRTT